MQYPLHPNRPFGLPKELEENPGHIWDMILDHVNDLDTIDGLRHVCTVFRDLLERKYVAARLPVIISHCLQRKFIPSNAGGRNGRNTWLETMLSLRILSTATKSSVDGLFFNRGMLRKGGWFYTASPHFCTEEGKMPILRLGTLNTEIVRLQKTLESTDPFPLRALSFDERQNREDDVDLQALRSSFHKCVKKIGGKITSFKYTTGENHLHVYNNLRSWVANMPNLEELIVHFTGPEATIFYQSVGAFPKLPRLKRYAEGPQGFGFPFIGEILKANPTIMQALVGKSISSDVEVNKMIHALDSLPLKWLFCNWEPSIPFLEHKFPWASQLTTFCIWDWDTNFNITKIPSSKLFSFLSTFRNLKTLVVSVRNLDNDGGYINLPHLEFVRWKINPNFSNLEPLRHVASLEKLELDFSGFEAITGTGKMMNYLWESGIPALFPALKVVRVITANNGAYRTVYKKIA